LPFVDKFLDNRFRGRPFLIKAVNASDISDFVLQHSHSMGVRTAQLMTTAFRSFFRFLLQKGELQADLAASVPTVADWRLSTVPKYLTPEKVEGHQLESRRNPHPRQGTASGPDAHS
jgi:site-specific recombinase XerC